MKLMKNQGRCWAAIIVDTITENRDRTVSDVRRCSTKNGARARKAQEIILNGIRKEAADVKAAEAKTAKEVQKASEAHAFAKKVDNDLRIRAEKALEKRRANGKGEYVRRIPVIAKTGNAREDELTVLMARKEAVGSKLYRFQKEMDDAQQALKDAADKHKSARQAYHIALDDFAAGDIDNDALMAKKKERKIAKHSEQCAVAAIKAMQKTLYSDARQYASIMNKLDRIAANNIAEFILKPNKDTGKDEFVCNVRKANKEELEILEGKIRAREQAIEDLYAAMTDAPVKEIVVTDEILKINEDVLAKCDERTGKYEDIDVEFLEDLLSERAAKEAESGHYCMNSARLDVSMVDTRTEDELKRRGVSREKLPDVKATPVYRQAGMENIFIAYCETIAERLTADQESIAQELRSAYSHLCAVHVDCENEDQLNLVLTLMVANGVDVTMPNGVTEHLVIWAMLPNSAKKAVAIYGPGRGSRALESFNQLCKFGDFNYAEYGEVKYLGLRASNLKNGAKIGRSLQEHEIIVLDNENWGNLKRPAVARVQRNMKTLIKRIVEDAAAQDINDGAALLTGWLAKSIGAGFHQFAGWTIKGGALCLEQNMAHIFNAAFPHIDMSTYKLTLKQKDGTTKVYSFCPEEGEYDLAKVCCILPYTVCKAMSLKGETEDQWIKDFCNGPAAGKFVVLNYGVHARNGIMSGQQFQSVIMSDEAWADAWENGDKLLEGAKTNPEVFGGRFRALLEVYGLRALSIPDVRTEFMRSAEYALMDNMSGRLVEYDWTRYICPDTVTLLASMFGITNFVPGLVLRELYTSNRSSGFVDFRRDPATSREAHYLCWARSPRVSAEARKLLYPDGVCFYGTLSADLTRMTAINIHAQSDNDGDKGRGCKAWYVIGSAILNTIEEPLGNELVADKVKKAPRSRMTCYTMAEAMEFARRGSQMGKPAKKLFTLHGTGLGIFLTSMIEEALTKAVPDMSETERKLVIANCAKEIEKNNEVLTWLLIDLSKHMVKTDGAFDPNQAYTKLLDMLMKLMGNGHEELWKRFDKNARKVALKFGKNAYNVPNVYSERLTWREGRDGVPMPWYADINAENQTGLNMNAQHYAEKFTDVTSGTFGLRADCMPTVTDGMKPDVNDFLDKTMKVVDGQKKYWSDYAPCTAKVGGMFTSVFVARVFKKLQDMRDMKAQMKRDGFEEGAIRAKSEEIRAYTNKVIDFIGKMDATTYSIVYNTFVAAAFGCLKSNGSWCMHSEYPRYLVPLGRGSRIMHFDTLWELFGDHMVECLKQNAPEGGYCTEGIGKGAIEGLAPDYVADKLFFALNPDEEEETEE